MFTLLALVPTDDLSQPYSPLFLVVAGIGLIALVALVLYWLTVCAIPNQQVGVVEKLWSAKGSVPEGSIIALNGEAGYQADLLRGGLHFGLWRWQYRVHSVPLVTIPQGKIGYVYARDGESLPPSQTLGRVVPCNNFQDARAFLGEAAEDGAEIVPGQRGRQRAILREGVYAINPALFVVITEDAVYRLPHLLGTREGEVVAGWQQQLSDVDGFSPVVVGAPSGPPTRSSPTRRSAWTASPSSRSRTARRWPPARSSPRPSASTRPTLITTTTTRIPRRSCGPAAAAAGSTCR